MNEEYYHEFSKRRKELILNKKSRNNKPILENSSDFQISVGPRIIVGSGSYLYHLGKDSM